jgi:hypothetical protein
LVIAARNKFPAALNMVEPWLQPIKHPDHAVSQLCKSGLCKQFPNDALKLLNRIIDDQPWAPNELRQCLDEIVQAEPKLETDARYRKLLTYSRKRRG